MEKRIYTGNEKSIFFQRYASHNLVAHTCNLLGLNLGGRNTGNLKYALRNDEQALNAVRSNGKPRQDFFDIPMQIFSVEHISTAEAALGRVRQFERDKGYDSSVSDMFQKSWDKFYGAYWKANDARLANEFIQMLDSRDWKKVLEEMQSITESEMPSDFYVVGVEATGGSATLIEPNISIGTIRSRGDCGFVHEGLHLLISAAEERYKPAYDFANSHPWTSEHKQKFPYPDWRGKVEQAVVVTLDSLISGKPEYLDGCRVGDLRKSVYVPLAKWYGNNQRTKMPLPEFLLELFKKKEKEIFR